MSCEKSIKRGENWRSYTHSFEGKGFLGSMIWTSLLSADSSSDPSSTTTSLPLILPLLSVPSRWPSLLPRSTSLGRLRSEVCHMHDHIHTHTPTQGKVTLTYQSVGGGGGRGDWHETIRIINTSYTQSAALTGEVRSTSSASSTPLSLVRSTTDPSPPTPSTHTHTHTHESAKLKRC